MRVAVLVLVAGILAGGDASALDDMDGRDVPLGEGRPALVFYGNRFTRHTLREEGFPFVYDLAASRPLVVVLVDLSDVPRLFKGFARGQVHRSWEESVAWMGQRFADAGRRPTVDLAGSLYYVIDDDGRRHAAEGLRSGFDVPLVVVLDRDGREVARGRFPEDAAALAAAVEAHGG